MSSTSRLSRREPSTANTTSLSRVSRQTASHDVANNGRADAADQSAAFPTGHSFESLQIESDARQRTTPDEPSLIQAFRCPGIVL